MESKNFLKSLIAIKIVVASLSLALYQGWLTFGDLPSFAEDTNTKDRNAISSDDIAKIDAKKADMSAEELDSELGKKESVPVDPKRKSFLADLFELPKLDPKSARKEEVGKYLDMADRRESQLKDREIMLQRREQQLKNIEKSIDDKLAKMDEERKYIAKTLQVEKDLKGERLEKLVTLFDKMEPKKAAKQVEQLDKDLVVGLMKSLKQKQVTTILEFMDPKKAVEFTEYFGRVKSAREYDLLKELNASLKKEFADCKGMVPETIASAPDAAALPPKNAQSSAVPANGVEKIDAKSGTNTNTKSDAPAH